MRKIVVILVFFLLVISAYGARPTYVPGRARLTVNSIEIRTCSDLGGVGENYGCYKSCLNKLEIEEGNELCSDLTNGQVGKCCGGGILESIEIISATPRLFPCPRYGYGIQINWTDTEIENADHYYIEYKENNGDWQVLDRKRSLEYSWKNHIGGNSCINKNNEECNQCLPIGATYEYRVKVQDIDNNDLTIWSNIQSVVMAHIECGDGVCDEDEDCAEDCEAAKSFARECEDGISINQCNSQGQICKSKRKQASIKVTADNEYWLHLNKNLRNLHADNRKKWKKLDYISVVLNDGDVLLFIARDGSETKGRERNKAGLIAEIDIEDEELIVTDENWKVFSAHTGSFFGYQQEYWISKDDRELKKLREIASPNYDLNDQELSNLGFTWKNADIMTKSTDSDFLNVISEDAKWIWNWKGETGDTSYLISNPVYFRKVIRFKNPVPELVTAESGECNIFNDRLSKQSALRNKDSSKCDLIQDNEIKYNCIQEYASTYNEISECNKIPNNNPLNKVCKGKVEVLRR